MDGLLTWTELVAAAGSAMHARRWVKEGAYWRVLRGAYADVSLDDSPAVRAAALRLVLPAGVALCGRAGLWAVGVDVLPSDGTLDVATRRGTHLQRRAGVRPHTARLTSDELVGLPGGLLAVSAARAVVDVARREPLVEAVACADAALRAGATTLGQLQLAVQRSAGLRGVVGARTVVQHVEPRSESQGESRLRMQLVLGGLPRPEAQVDYYDEHGAHVARADLVVEGVVLEYDGREPHSRDDVFTQDRRRQNRLVDHGVELRRFTGADVRPAHASALCAVVRRAIAVAAGRGAPRVHRGPDTLRPPRLAPLPTRADLAARAAA